MSEHIATTTSRAELIAQYNKLVEHYNYMVIEGFSAQDKELQEIGQQPMLIKRQLEIWAQN
jgi:hypothetical protein